MTNIQRAQLRLCWVGIELHIPIEIVTPAIRRIPNPDGNGYNGIPTRLHRLLHELHAGFFRRATALFVVTTPACRHNIFPGLSPTLGDRDDMIERQLFSPELMTTVLAGIAVSRKDIDAGELDCPMNILEPNQLEQAHDGGKLDGDRYCVDLSVVDLEDFDFALPEKRNRLLPMDDPEGFVRCVQQKGHFHAVTSFPTEAPCMREPKCSIGIRT